MPRWRLASPRTVSNYSAVADGVSPPVREVACAGNKSQAETPEPKVSRGIPRNTHSPKRLPWGHPYLHSLFRGLPASVPAKHLCPPGEPVELPNFMDAAPAGAKAAAVSAAAPHPARAAAPHAVAESPADQEFRPDWSDESDVEMGPPSLPQEEDGESDLDDYWDDGRKVNHQDCNTSAVADGNENSDLAQKEKKWDKNTQRLRHRDSHYRENRERRWCKYCQRASHHTYRCWCLAEAWHRFCFKSKSWEISCRICSLVNFFAIVSIIKRSLNMHESGSVCTYSSACLASCATRLSKRSRN